MAKQQSTKKVKVESQIQPQLILFTLVIAAVASIGAYFISKSSAATTSPTYVWVTGSTAAIAPVTIVSDNIQFPATSIKAVQISNGSQITYGGAGGGGIKNIKTCYWLRAVDNVAKVKIIGPGSAKTVTVPKSNNYQEYCAVAGTSTTVYNFNVKHVSGSKVNVYQMITYLQVTDPAVIF